jgi:uncharacterized phage-like protein YoqJ
MRERNEYMVDNSAHLIAVCNGSKGGTQETLRYAKQKGLRIVTIDPRTPMDEIFVSEQFVF